MRKDIDRDSIATRCYAAFRVTFGSGKCDVCGSWLVGGTCDNRCELKGCCGMSIIESLLMELEERACDLRCRNVPTGGDDYDIQWFVVEHHMAEPKDREIGAGRDPVEAMLEAFHGITKDVLINAEKE